MKKEIPVPVFVAVVVVALVGIGVYMFRAAMPHQRPEGAPSNLQKLTEGFAKEHGFTLRHNRKKDD